jgi:hypothetical protein
VITVDGLLPWRRVLPPQPPPVPGRERAAEETADARPPAGLDPVVFGTWPGTYYPATGEPC